MHTLKAALTLALLSPVLTELISASTPLLAFLSPGTFAFLLLGYGLPVLLLREWALRWRLGYGGVFACGAAYGLFNEGLLSKTIILQSGLPLPLFDRYGVWLGISFPWAATISLWHALAAILMPIVFTDLLFPDVREKAWLPFPLTVILSAALLLLACAAFLGKQRVTGTPDQLAVLLALMALCLLLARLLARKRPQHVPAQPASLKPLMLGLAVLPASLTLSAMAGIKAPLPLFFAALAGVAAGFARILKARGWLAAPGLALFGLGAYMQSTALAIVVSFALHRAVIEAAAVGVAAEAAMAWVALRLRAATGSADPERRPAWR